MAPGHPSPFNHRPILTSHFSSRWRETLNNNNINNILSTIPTPSPSLLLDSSLPAIAILLCGIIILLLAIFNIFKALKSQKDYVASQPEMSSSNEPMGRRVTPNARPHVREIFRERSGSTSGVLRPLLPTKNHPLAVGLDREQEELDYGTQRSDGSISWHGDNTLNTAWGWMA